MKHSKIALATVLAAVVLVGCSSSAEETPADTQSAAANSISALVPADIAADGVLTFGSDGTYAPNEFVGEDNITMEGMSIDLGNAIAEKLGLKAEFNNSPFDAIIPAVQSGKYEAGLSSFTITAERMQVVDFVSYYTAGTSWAGPAGSTIDPDNVCGLSIAVQKGTVQVDDLAARSKACTDAGKSAIKVNQYQSQQEAATTVMSGKNAAMLADSPITGYAIAQSEGKLVLAGAVYGAAPYGIALPKDKEQFAEAVRQAIQSIIDDGTYASILDKWGATDGAITTSEVNPMV